jgi:hypothetical protein
MLKVYRYEIKDKTLGKDIGMGVYTCNSTNIPFKLRRDWRRLEVRINTKHENNVNTPGVRVDVIGFTNYHFCGCGTQKKLEKWFDGFNAELILMGFNLVEYHVKKRITGKSKKQCVFDPNDVVRKIILK